MIAAAMAAFGVGVLYAEAPVSASNGVSLTYDFATGTHGCPSSVGTSPATSFDGAIIGGPFTETAGCGTGWSPTGWGVTGTSPGLDTQFMDASTFPFFSFTLTTPTLLNSMAFVGWTNPQWWTGAPGYAVQISGADQPLPTSSNPGASWTTIGHLAVNSFFNASLPVTAVLQPGTYAVRIIGNSTPEPSTTQLVFTSVKLTGRSLGAPLRFLGMTGPASAQGPGSIVPAATGTVGQLLFDVLHSTGGVGYGVWSLAGGTLPPGVRLEPSGAVIGTPTRAGTYTFTAQVEDLAANTARTTVTVTVSGPPAASATVSASVSGPLFEGGPAAMASRGRPLPRIR